MDGVIHQDVLEHHMMKKTAEKIIAASRDAVANFQMEMKYLDDQIELLLQEMRARYEKSVVRE